MTPEEEPDFWPDGADEEYVRWEAEWGCDYCQSLIDALEDYRQGIALDGEHAALTAYTDGGETV